MDNLDIIKVVGGNKLNGRIKIQGAKNSALPIVIASILNNGKNIFYNVPNLSDINLVMQILEELNATCEYEKDNNILKVDTTFVNKYEASYELVNKMRASVLILGPLLAKYKKAIVPLPGGCTIGSRPVDIHINALKLMGADIKIENGNIVASANNGLTGCDISFPKISVGATENLMMASVLAKGNTRLINCACEPEIVDLANFLNKMGAKIKGAGTKLIEIEGVEVLNSAEHTIIPDRIEIGSYAIATIATGGRVILENANMDILGEFVDTILATGSSIKQLDANSIEVAYGGEIKPIDITTAEYPAFPTDLQSPITSLLSIAKGMSLVVENIFENRFTHIPELRKMGADIEIKDTHNAVIHGVERLSGARVNATDLRASFALIIAGLVASGETTIANLHHLDRGYVNVVENLSSLGANIKRGVNI